MTITFCTIITADYIHYALSLYESLSRFGDTQKFSILIADKNISFNHLQTTFPLIEICYPENICEDKYSLEILRKYKNDYKDAFRWSMKSVFIKYLLERGDEQVFFLDPDLYFYDYFDFLIQELEGHSILLTPHWRACDPYEDPSNFAVLQTSGLFNAGFVGATQKAIPALEWWSKVCAYKCIKAPDKGFFDDQAYLDLMPIYFEKVKILRHQGCNVANWNQIECKRTITEDGEVLINNQWKIIFIHFTLSTINGIRSGQDNLLMSCLEEYEAALEKFSSWIPNGYQQCKTHHQPLDVKVQASFLGKLRKRSRQFAGKIKRKITS